MHQDPACDVGKLVRESSADIPEDLPDTFKTRQNDMCCFQIFAKQAEIPQKTRKISADTSARLFRVTCNKVSGILIHKN